MATVISPKLKLFCDDLGNSRTRKPWLCMENLRGLIYFPKAKFYWLEVSTHQWKNGSGKQVYVCIDRDWYGYTKVEYRLHEDAPWQPLHPTLRGFLRKLGVVPGEDSKVVYFRLLYEE